MGRLTILVIILLLTSINLSLATNITSSVSSGVAPLSVIVYDSDGTVDSDGVGVDPFRDYYYSWNFGDNSEDLWQDGKSKNTATGAVSAHVFEAAGNYTISLTVTNSTTGATVGTDTYLISVSDTDTIYAGALTTCVNNYGDTIFTGCPDSANHIDTDDLTTVVGYGDPGERVLFKRGGEWTLSSLPSWPTNDGSSPTLLGAYGECTSEDSIGICSNAPQITLSGSTQFIDLSNHSNYKIVDLTFVGSGSNAAIAGGYGVQDVLLKGIKATSFDINISTSLYRTSNDDSDKIKNVVIIESVFGPGANYGLYMHSDGSAIMGCDVQGGGEHTVRYTGGYMAVISHNLISGASYYTSDTAYGGQALKFHGPNELSGENEVGSFNDVWAAANDPDIRRNATDNRTKFVVISDNVFGGSGPWPVSIGPQNGFRDERISDVVIERNKYIAEYGNQSGGVQMAFNVRANYVTIRNNHIDLTGAESTYFQAAFCSEKETLAPAPAGTQIYNNTVYRGDVSTQGTLSMYQIETSSESATIYNNLVFGPSTTSVSLGYNNATTAVMDNNIILSGDYLTDTGNADPLLRDFSLTALAIEAIDQGTTVPVYDDFLGNSRVGLAYDIGAHEYGAGVTVSSPIHKALFGGKAALGGRMYLSD